MKKALDYVSLGYRPAGDSMDLSDGTMNLTLLPYPGPARTTLEEGTEFIHLGLLVDDLAMVYQRLLALGAPIVRDDVKERRVHDTSQVPVGSFKVLDPDGNVLDISDQPQEWRT